MSEGESEGESVFEVVVEGGNVRRVYGYAHATRTRSRSPPTNTNTNTDSDTDSPSDSHTDAAGHSTMRISFITCARNATPCFFV